MTSDVFSKVTLDRNCRIKLHEVQTEISRGTNLVKRKFAMYSTETVITEKVMCDQYRDFSAKRGKTEVDWQKILDNGDVDPCFTAEQALAIGLCDEVI
jgi:ATP-dependent protease ClpP protease subunit